MPSITLSVMLVVTRLTRRVSLVEQKLLILPEHMSSLPGFSGVRVTSSLVFCIMFCRSLFVPFVLFHLAIVLSVLLRYTDSDYRFGIFKHFLAITMFQLIAVLPVWILIFYSYPVSHFRKPISAPFNIIRPCNLCLGTICSKSELLITDTCAIRTLNHQVLLSMYRLTL